MTYLEKQDNEPVNLRLVIGGKQPPRKGNNWLQELKQWTMFLAKNPKLASCDLFRFQVREKYGNSTCLVVFFPTEQPQFRFFSTVDFSNEYILMDIIDEPEPDNRTDLDRRLEVDANIAEDNTMGDEARSEVLRTHSGDGEETLPRDKE